MKFCSIKLLPNNLDIDGFAAFVDGFDSDFDALTFF